MSSQSHWKLEPLSKARTSLIRPRYLIPVPLISGLDPHKLSYQRFPYLCRSGFSRAGNAYNHCPVWPAK